MTRYHLAVLGREILLGLSILPRNQAGRYTTSKTGEKDSSAPQKECNTSSSNGETRSTARRRDYGEGRQWWKTNTAPPVGPPWSEHGRFTARPFRPRPVQNGGDKNAPSNAPVNSSSFTNGESSIKPILVTVNTTSGRRHKFLFSSRTCGDVEPNPGPQGGATKRTTPPTVNHIKSGRGDGIHTCGDVELNPGPQEQAGDASNQSVTSSCGPTPTVQGIQGPLTTLLPLRLLEMQGLRSAALPPLASTQGSPAASTTAQVHGRQGPRALDCSRDAPLLPAPPASGAPPADFEVDLAHPEEILDMVHRVDGLGNAVHIHATRPSNTTLTLPEPLPFHDLLQARVSTIRHVPAALQQQVSTVLAAALTRYTAEPTDGHLFVLLGFPKLVLRSVKSRESFQRRQ